MRRRSSGWFVMLVLAVTLVLAGCSQQGGVSLREAADEREEQAQQSDDAASQEAPAEAEDEEEAAPEFYGPGEGYTLQEVVVLSRHNIRAPLSSNDSVLGRACTHEWIDWTAQASELTLRGGASETLMGQYVRTWLEAEELIPLNYQPSQGEVRFYANAKQRTMATAQYFSSGMLPVANVDIETQAPFDTMDPTFTPKFTFVSDAYREAALEQIAERGGKEGMAGVAADLADSYELIEDVVDYRSSEGYRSGELEDLATDDTGVAMELGEEPAMEGSLKLACQMSDALVLQYYEAPTATDAAFGKELSFEQWQSISSIKDTYVDVLFGSPLVATNVAHPLLELIGNELDMEGRKFTFLCGHDSNVASVLAAMGVEPYELSGAIEAKTPIGCMLVFEKWADAKGQLYGRVRLMYQTADQLRNLDLLQNGEAPASVELTFDGLEKNSDGLYAFEDLRGRLDEASSAYFSLRADYADEEEPAEADQADEEEPVEEELDEAA